MSEKLAEDWVALWRSELTAMGADRELREHWAAMVALWASTANGAIGLMNIRNEQPHGATIPPQPARSAATDAASVARLDEVASLNRRIAELERRLAAFERGGLARN